MTKLLGLSVYLFVAASQKRSGPKIALMPEIAVCCGVLQGEDFSRPFGKSNLVKKVVCGQERKVLALFCRRIH